MATPDSPAPVPVPRPPLRARITAFLRAAPEVPILLAWLGVVFTLFTSRWDLWEDESVYQYMAWGVRHHMVLYRDTINMNWPGVVVMHLAGQALLGSAPMGTRLIEALMLGALVFGTSSILRSQAAPPWLRLAGMAAFFLAYFGDGYMHTAQRESFQTGWLALAVVPPLVYSGARPSSVGRWALAGAAAAMALWIKPPGVVPIAVALACSLLYADKIDRRLALRILSFIGGALLVSLAFIAFIAIWGDPRGFYLWGIEYTFTAYAPLKLSPEKRLEDFQALFESDSRGWLRAGLWLGAAALPLAVLERVSRWADDASAGCPAPLGAMQRIFAGARSLATRVELRRRAWAGARASTRPIVSTFLLTAAIGWTIYYQGKTYSPNHFIPLWWALSLLVVALASPLAQVGRSRRFGVTALLLTCGLLVPLTIEVGRQAEGPHSFALSDNLRSTLLPEEQVVIFGFVPTMLMKLERVTPMPFVDSWMMYVGTAQKPQFLNPYLSLWTRALENPHVRFYIVQRGVRHATERNSLSENISARYFPESRLRELGFTRSTSLGFLPNFIVYERLAPTSDLPAGTALP